MFVVFEGIDGSGKTTVSNRVVKRLVERGLSVKHVRAEGKFASSVTEAVRALARDVRNLALVPKAEFLLYVAREVQLLEEALLPALSSHDVVIADRFLYTAEVLARYGRRVDDEFIGAVIGAASRELMPDLTVLVDVDPLLARARRRVQKLETVDLKPPSRKGLTGSGLQHRLRHGYLRLAASAPERWAAVDNDDELERIVDRVTTLILDAREKSVWRTLVAFREENDSQKKERAKRPVRTRKDALDAYLDWVRRRATLEPKVAAYFLSGFSGETVDPLRLELAERAPVPLLAGSRGLLDELSVALRDKLANDLPGPVARSLGGIPNSHPASQALRRALLERAGAEVAASLGGLDDDEAWALREALYERYPNQVMSSLGGLESERAWALRERWLERYQRELDASYELARVAARSVRGVPGERAFLVRERARAAAPIESLRSIVGLTDEKSFQWRAEAIRRAPRPVMETLRGIDDERAWELRLRVVVDCREALDGMAGADVPPAWELRESYADVWPCAVVKSLGPLADTDRGEALLSRQLERHSENPNVLRHTAAIALGAHLNHTAFAEEPSA
jgi:dTMP kinase